MSILQNLGIEILCVVKNEQYLGMWMLRSEWVFHFKMKLLNGKLLLRSGLIRCYEIKSIGLIILNHQELFI